MSLLIKALDKAQEKAQDAKVKHAQADTGQGRAKKAQNKRSKAPTLELAIADTDSDSALSLSPPQSAISQEIGSDETGFEALEFEADLLPVSLRESAVSKVAATATAANTGAAIKNAETVEFKPAEKTAQIQPSAYIAPSVKATPRTPSSLDPRAKLSSPAQAANVFSAKGVEPTSQNTKLAIIAGAGLIAMLGMGVYYYQFVDSTPDLPMPMRPPQIAAVTPEPVVPAPAPPEASLPEMLPPEVVAAAEATKAFEPLEPTQMAQKQKNIASAKSQNLDEENVENTLDENEEVAAPRKRGVKSSTVKMDKSIASESASIQVSQSKPQDAINPTLMRAYDTYNAGNLNDAQKLYKQVLQRDDNNVDAMLGLGAIAARQGRTADANGWHRKVLSIDPRNSTAQAAMADAQQQENPQTAESRIKSMIANSPNDADLHAALGNLYAEQNQWSAAQQAYFDAYRLNESAEHAFNLGVSLDQLGKPKLALPYYQQALQMTQQSSTSGIDKSALEARIAAIQ